MRLSMLLAVLALVVQSVVGVPSGFVAEGLLNVVAITGAFAPNPRNGGKAMLLLSSKNGKVRVVEDPDSNPEDQFVIADLEDRMCSNGERGLQSIRPHPDFNINNYYIYMYYTAFRTDCLEDQYEGPQNRLARYEIDPDTLLVNLDSEFILVESSPLPNFIHNGGTINFGNDGMLYVTMGDGGTRNPPYAQQFNNLHGSILRLLDDGSVPSDNPFASDGVLCSQSEGAADEGDVCAEIFAVGFRNPFRLAMNPNEKSKVQFHIGDVGGATWEEISEGGTDFAGFNYGWPISEGPCYLDSTVNCPTGTGFVDPLYYYEHREDTDGDGPLEGGGAVTGGVFVPEDAGWPAEYKYLFIDFIFGEIYNLIEDDTNACRTCTPPIPAYRNETFHEFQYMVDMFFGPYKDEQALYIVAREGNPNILRIRYTGTGNQSPVADAQVDQTSPVSIGQTIGFDASGSSDPDGDDLTYSWDFGDGTTSTDLSPQHSYETKGEYIVTLIVSDPDGLSNQASVTIAVGVPPTAEIISPVDGEEFHVGQVFRLVGSGTTANGDVIPDTQLFWEVQQHHESHYHPFLDLTAGNDIEISPAPEPEDFKAATNSYLLILLTAVDEDGLTTTVTRRVDPVIVLVDVETDPPGLFVILDEFPVETPATVTSWENHNLRLNVEDQTPFVFQYWSSYDSDPTDRVQLVRVPNATSAKLTITATFNESTGVDFLPVRECNSSYPCGACEGDCNVDSDCQDTLYCFEHEGGLPVPGCIGIDNSRTSWCISKIHESSNPVNTSTELDFLPVRDCNSSFPCEACEGHCVADTDCQDSLLCFTKETAGISVPGCNGVDNSRTSWCINVVSSPSPSPLLQWWSANLTAAPTTPSPITPSPIVQITFPPEGLSLQTSSPEAPSLVTELPPFEEAVPLSSPESSGITRSISFFCLSFIALMF